MGEYTDVLRTKGMFRVVASQLFARFPFGMMALAFVLHIQRITNTYTWAGLGLGAETLGVAISGPILGRLMSRRGVASLLVATASISTLAILAIAFAPVSGPWLVVLCLVVGLSSPPIQQAVRTVYPKMLDKKHYGVIYALDANLQEIIWVVGPVLATFIAAWISTTAGVVILALVQIVGALWFVSNPEIKTLVIPKSNRRMGGVLKNKIVISNAIMAGFLVGSFSGVEVGSVGALHDTATAGWVIAFLSLGSLIGGFAFGHRSRTKFALSKFMVVVVIGYALVYVAPTNAYWMATAWFLAGLGVAPALGLLSAIIGASLPTRDTPEAYGWVMTGQMVGYAAAASLVGILIDTVSPEASLSIAALFALGTLIVALWSSKFTPVVSTAVSEH